MASAGEEESKKKAEEEKARRQAKEQREKEESTKREEVSDSICRTSSNPSWFIWGLEFLEKPGILKDLFPGLIYM
jgi:hypothetical protein